MVRIICAVMAAAGAMPSAIALMKKENEKEKETEHIAVLSIAGITLIAAGVLNSGAGLKNMICLAEVVFGIAFACDTAAKIKNEEKEKRRKHLPTILECISIAVLLISAYA